MKLEDITNYIVSVDGRGMFRHIVGDSSARLLDIEKSAPEDLEPIIVTDNGDETEPWWSDDAQFIFDLCACRTNGSANDWPAGLEEFEVEYMVNPPTEPIRFTSGDHVLDIRPSSDDLSCIGKLCPQD